VRQRSGITIPFNFVYCLAGKGRRFTEQNITLPKYLLELGPGQTVLEKSVAEFNFSTEVNLLLIINEEHRDFAAQIKEVLSRQINSCKVVITADTKGQAETGFIGCNNIDNSNPVFFFNGDTILKNRDITEMAQDLSTRFTGAIDVFLEDREHFSFVQLSEESLVEKIAEKQAISRFATTGLYGFSDKDTYIRHYHQISSSGEMYISDIYKMMIAEGELIRGYVFEDEGDTIILGTPEEYFSNKDRV
jgi:dTDP-glucose pyrophosphorylase